MDQNQNFDPFIDWESVTQEMVDDFHNKMKSFRTSSDQFIENPTKEVLVEVLRFQEALSNNYQAIMSTLYTVPAMVHVAGEKKQEDNEAHGHSHSVLQRCSRCGSVLAFWRPGITMMTAEGPAEVSEDDMDWWEVGASVAKAVHDTGGAMYVIDERELEPYEKYCLDLSILEG